MSTISHIGLILDGNRRYAQKHTKPFIWGHKQGAEKFFSILKHIMTHTTITQVSAYVLSLENLHRDEHQVSDLLSLFLTYASEFDERQAETKQKAKVRFAGDIARFEPHIQEKIREIEHKTAHYTDGILNICFGYSGKDEIVRATQKLIDSDTKITQESITNALDISDSPQLIIRTGGFCRMSNFLLWQSAYTEWFFVPELWPEFTTTQLDSILTQFTSVTQNNGR